jgi:hypothetical protein
MRFVESGTDGDLLVSPGVRTSPAETSEDLFSLLLVVTPAPAALLHAMAPSNAATMIMGAERLRRLLCMY